ncbi:MAG: VOC family protein [Candidatus Omnitrophota bacterium]
MKLGHIALSVSDLKRSAVFYRRHFGLRHVKTYAYPDKGFTIMLLKNGDITLELFEFKKQKALPEYRKTLLKDLLTLGVKHFSVEVSNITAVYRKFRNAGISLASELCRFDSGARYFFIQDPDGILVEIMEAL